jgi:cytochrome c556
MKLRTMLASLLVVGVLATGVYSQEKKEGKRGPGFQPLKFEEGDANKDGKLTKDEYCAASLKRFPEEKKEKAKEWIERGWKRMAGDKAELTKDEYDAAVKKMQEERKNRGGKKRGEKKEA